MLDLGFWEIVTVIVIAVLVLKPEDIPQLLRSIGQVMGKLQSFGKEMKTVVRDIAKDVGVDDLKHEMQQIIDLEGNVQQAYKVEDIEELQRKPTNHNENGIAK